MDLDQLSARGVRICLQENQPFAAAVRAIHETLKALHEGIPPTKLEFVISPEHMKQVTRAAEYERQTRAYLGGFRA